MKKSIPFSFPEIAFRQDSQPPELASHYGSSGRKLSGVSLEQWLFGKAPKEQEVMGEDMAHAAQTEPSQADVMAADGKNDQVSVPDEGIAGISVS